MKNINKKKSFLLVWLWINIGKSISIEYSFLKGLVFDIVSLISKLNFWKLVKIVQKVIKKGS